MSVRVKVDGRETVLTWNDKTDKGHQYLEHDRDANYRLISCMRHYFNVHLKELPVGFAFKTKGRLYEILEIL